MSVTLAVAIYGAILGTIGTVVSAVLAVNELRRSHPKVRVTAQFKDISLPLHFLGDPDPPKSWPGIEVRVVNIRPRPVRIVSIAIATSRGDFVAEIEITNAGTAKLGLADSISVTFDLSTLIKKATGEGWDLRRARVMVKDEEDRRYAIKLPTQVTERLLIGA